jgi:8-oxo-dGTP pyrophosphatase MutT (NUDIX family)
MLFFMLGHSTRDFGEFLSILKALQVEVLVDIRHFPTSKKFPWFSKENLEKTLVKEGIEYIWLEELGGFRKGGYENYTKTENYAKGIGKLLELGKNKRVAIMCAELKWWKCHRRYVADSLVEKGCEVIHVWDLKKKEKHEWLKYRERRVRCDKIKEGVEAVIYKDGKFLILQRKSGEWQFLIGKREANENSLETLFREIKEETGIEKENILRVEFLCKNGFIYRGKQIVLDVFLVEVNSKDIKLSEEHKSFKWVSLDELQEVLRFDEKVVELLRKKFE